MFIFPLQGKKYPYKYLITFLLLQRPGILEMLPPSCSFSVACYRYFNVSLKLMVVSWEEFGTLTKELIKEKMFLR